MVKVPEILEYEGEKYKFLRARNNVLIYTKDPVYYFDDWQDDGEILVVMFYANRTEGNAFEVVHKLMVPYNGGRIEDYNISKENKMARPYQK